LVYILHSHALPFCLQKTEVLCCVCSHPPFEHRELAGHVHHNQTTANLTVFNHISTLHSFHSIRIRVCSIFHSNKHSYIHSLRTQSHYPFNNNTQESTRFYFLHLTKLFSFLLKTKRFLCWLLTRPAGRQVYEPATSGCNRS
jgi:hypothetical protein